MILLTNTNVSFSQYIVDTLMTLMCQFLMPDFYVHVNSGGRIEGREGVVPPRICPFFTSMHTRVGMCNYMQEYRGKVCILGNLKRAEAGKV